MRTRKAGFAVSATALALLALPAAAGEFAPLGANWFIVGSDQSILLRGGKDIAAYAAQPVKLEGNPA